jgi:hypothetical protein
MDRQGSGESHWETIGNKTQATGGRDGVKTIQTRGNPVDLTVDQGRFCHESRTGVAGHSLLDD